MTNRVSKDDAYEVSDSTDWLKTPLQSLAAVDSALRCQVCKDFYTTPMITSCAHTFCSLCIRRCLNNDGKCPACRGNDQELKLRFNGAMEELVQAFIKARPEVLEYARKPDIVARSTSPKRSREEAQLEEDEGPRKRTRSSGRTQPKQRVVVLDSDLDDDDYVTEEGFVLCPVCQKEVKEEIINAHLDRNCEEEPAGKAHKVSVQVPAPTQQKPAKPLERLAQVNFSMLKDGPLRKKLTDQGLSATGSRTLMIQRYTEWITLWNANCDATKPKSKGELKREMEVWERTQGGRAPSSGISHISGAQIRDKDFDGAAWSSKHDGDFQMLIANARRKAQVKPSTSEPPLNQHDSSTVTDSASGVAASPSSAAVDTEMINVAEDHIQPPQNNLPLLTASQEASPAKRRFFLESNNPHIDGITAPSSQNQSSMSADEESGMASDITTPRPIQP